MSEKNNKKKKKNSQMIIRINDEERAQFIELCEELDTSAAREVRRFILAVKHYERTINRKDSYYG